MKNTGKVYGYTLIELMIVIMMVVIVCITLSGGVLICTSNAWFTESGVLKAIQSEHPDIVEVVNTHRNMVAYSEIIVRNKDGSRGTFFLDSNLLFNYTFFSK